MLHNHLPLLLLKQTKAYSNYKAISISSARLNTKENIAVQVLYRSTQITKFMLHVNAKCQCYVKKKSPTSLALSSLYITIMTTQNLTIIGKKPPYSELVQYIPFAREVCEVLDKWEGGKEFNQVFPIHCHSLSGCQLK